MKFPGFIGPSYQLESISVDCQRSVNLYPEMDEMGTAKDQSVGSLIGRPGLSTPLVTLPTSPFRGRWLASNGQLFVCSGNTLYTINTDWSYTANGTLTTSTGPVSMKDNGGNLMLVDGQNGYFLPLLAPPLPPPALVRITSTNFLGPATQIAYMDGIFIFNIPGTNQFFVSDQLATTFSGLFDSASSQPDNLVGMATINKNLFLFGTGSTEVWFDAGNAPPFTPFSIIQGGFIDIGCAAAFSIQKIDNTLLFIGQDEARGQGTVYEMQGFAPQRISTFAVEQAIQNVSDISGTTSYTYQEDGHNFYCINLKNAAGQSMTNSTWCYDMDTKMWHERCYLSGGILLRHIVEGHAFFNGKHVVGDYNSGNLYEQNLNFYSDNGNARACERTFPHLNAGLKRIFNASLQLDMETGVGIDGLGQGVTPQAMLQFSDNGGFSWSNEKWAGIGAIGAKKTRVLWRRLGQARDKVYKIRITDPVKVVLIGVEILAGAAQK